MILKALEIIFGCGFTAALLGWLIFDVRKSIKGEKRHHFADLEGRYGWNEDGPRDKPTKLEARIAKYMEADPLDPSATLEFLMEVDALKDPFADAPDWAQKIEDKRKALPPPKPSDAATSARPPWARKGPVYSVMDDLARAYSMNAHYMGEDHASEIAHMRALVQCGAITHREAERWFNENGHCAMCGYSGTVGGGVCKLCGHHRERNWRDFGGNQWTVTDEHGKATGIVYYDKQRALEDAYKLQCLDPTRRFVLDAYGKRECVAPPPVLMASGGIKRIGLTNRWRDSKGRFCKSPEWFEQSMREQFVQPISAANRTILPVDEPYSIPAHRIAYAPLPTTKILD